MKMYRFVDTASGRIKLLEYTVVKTTAKGKWIEDPDAFKLRFVLNSGKKRFAHDTIADALNSLKCRKIRQVEILSAQLNQAKVSLNLTKKMMCSFK